MSSHTRAIMGALKSALAGINGSGGYTYDLSATDRVKIGRPSLTEGLSPCVWIALGQLDSDHGPQLGRYTRTLSIDLEGRVPLDGGNTTEERELEAVDLLDDICAALEADRTLGGRVLDLIVQGTTVGAGSSANTQPARVLAQIVVYWHANSAAGV